MGFFARFLCATGGTPYELSAAEAWASGWVADAAANAETEAMQLAATRMLSQRFIAESPDSRNRRVEKEQSIRARPHSTPHGDRVQASTDVSQYHETISFLHRVKGLVRFTTQPAYNFGIGCRVRVARAAGDLSPRDMASYVRGQPADMFAEYCSDTAYRRVDCMIA